MPEFLPMMDFLRESVCTKIANFANLSNVEHLLQESNNILTKFAFIRRNFFYKKIDVLFRIILKLN